MNKKYNGSVLIWFICFLMLISSIVMIKLEDVYRKNQILELEVKGFQVEQDMYSTMLYFFENYKDRMLEDVFKNYNSQGLTNLDTDKYSPNKFINEKVTFESMIALDSLLNINMNYRAENTLTGANFTVDTVNKILSTCKDEVIDNTSDNIFQNEKNRLINQALENLEPLYDEQFMTIIELEPGDNYITIENLQIIVKNGDREVLKTPFTVTTYITGPDPNTNIYFELPDGFGFDRLYIFNNGNIQSDSLDFSGFICIKSGNLFINEIKGSGRIIIDGYLQAINRDKVNMGEFKIANKFALINRVFADPRIINYKR